MASVTSFQKPLSRLTEKSSQLTVGLGQTRPDYVNSDLSDLDRNLVPPNAAEKESNNVKDLRKSQPTKLERPARLDSIEKGLIKIKVKH